MHGLPRCVRVRSDLAPTERNHAAARLPENPLDPPDLAGLQANLDPVGVVRRAREYIPDDSFGELAGALILLQDDRHMDSGSYVRTP
jgi:hypothetical protein